VIVQHVRHGRSARDARNLAAHLMRADDNEEVVTLSVRGVVAPDVGGALDAMRRLAPRQNAAAFHHISFSPGADQSDADLIADARRVLAEMGAEDHAAILIRHTKPSAAGRSATHAHLVVSHWSLEGRALDDGWLHLRLERLAREIEFDRGHCLTRGRHDRALMKALRDRGRSDVADALASLSQPDPPRSAVTSSRRQALAREGVKEVDARAATKVAWDRSDSRAAFESALADAGLTLAAGRKTGVWIVMQGGVEVGALDRLLRVKRAEVQARLEAVTPVITPAVTPSNPTLLDALAAFERDARRRYGRSVQPVTRPAALDAEQVRIAALSRDVRILQAERDQLAQDLERAWLARPRGLWAWLTGRARRHEAGIHAMTRGLKSTTRQCEIASRKHVRASSTFEKRLAAWDAKATAIESDRAAAKVAASNDLRRVEIARRFLKAHPDLAAASDPDDLFRKVEERRRQEDEERRRREADLKKPKSFAASRQPVPGGLRPALTPRPPSAVRHL
jgi:hypothetical protein